MKDETYDKIKNYFGKHFIAEWLLYRGSEPYKLNHDIYENKAFLKCLYSFHNDAKGLTVIFDYIVLGWVLVLFPFLGTIFDGIGNIIDFRGWDSLGAILKAVLIVGVYAFLARLIWAQFKRSRAKKFNKFIELFIEREGRKEEETYEPSEEQEEEQHATSTASDDEFYKLMHKIDML